MTAVTLVVNPSSSTAPLTITGSLTNYVYPGGATQPLDLTLKNPNSVPVTINKITVTVSVTLASHPPPPGTCSSGDFSVTQYSGPSFTVSANGAATLSSVVTNQTQLPQIEMRDQPYNQDGCKGATLNFSYTSYAGS
jgi:hypothetical protein